MKHAAHPSVNHRAGHERTDDEHHPLAHRAGKRHSGDDHGRIVREMRAKWLWTNYTIMSLGLWLALGALSLRGEARPQTANDAGCGLLLMALAALALIPRFDTDLLGEESRIVFQRHARRRARHRAFDSRANDPRRWVGHPRLISAKIFRHENTTFYQLRARVNVGEWRSLDEFRLRRHANQGEHRTDGR